MSENKNKHLSELAEKLKGMGDVVKNYKLPEIERHLIPVNLINETPRNLRNPTHDLIDTIKEQHATEEEYFKSILETLQNIEKNTSGIIEIVALVRDSGEKQDQIIQLLQEIIIVGTAKTKEEADNLFRRALQGINKVGGTIQSFQALYGVLNTVYNSVVSMIDKST